MYDRSRIHRTYIYIYYIYMWTQDIQATWIPSSKLPLPGRTGRDAHRGRHRRGTKYLPPPRGCRGSGRRSATAEANQICDGLQWHPGDFVFLMGNDIFLGAWKDGLEWEVNDWNDHLSLMKLWRFRGYRLLLCWAGEKRAVGEVTKQWIWCEYVIYLER